MSGRVRTVMSSARMSWPAGFVASSATLWKSSAVGVPESTPVVALNASHDGSPFTESCGCVPDAVSV